jgi:hypothetical protein
MNEIKCKNEMNANNNETSRVIETTSEACDITTLKMTSSTLWMPI